MNDAILREILKLLIAIALFLGVAVPQSATDLLNPNMPPTPTPEYAPIQQVTFTPHLGYVINLRSDCGRNYPIIAKVTKPVVVINTLIDRDGYQWVYVASGGCIAIRQGSDSFGTFQ